MDNQMAYEEDILEKLNDKQKEAVLETEGYVRVIAGAGSGKTKLLVSRYAYLVQEYGIDSANILCVTFTNKAAGEMRRRIKALIGDGYDTTLICTYHGFCNRLLRENPEKLFLNKQFQIIDGYQQKAILGEIYQKFELKLDYASFESMLHKLGAFKSKTDYVTRICDPNPCQIMDQVVTQDDEILEEFLQRQKATYSLDFHDLIAFAIHLLETDAAIREKWQERLNYIMVDEFQDSSSTEMHLIEILSDHFKNLMIVGDPDQNIYEWRGSDVKLLVDFDKEHMPTETIILNQNYRSTPEILRCANTLIEKNTLRLKKDLFTHNPSGAPVIHYHSKNDYDEMDQVVNNIKQLIRTEKYKYSDFAILYRSGFLSRIAEKKLVERNIPYEIFGGVRFYQRMEILDILAYLKLIAFDDDLSFKRIINTPRRRFGRAKLGLLESIKDGNIGYEMSLQIEEEGSISMPSDEDQRKSLYSTLKANLGHKDFVKSDADKFVVFVDEMRKKLKNASISEIVNAVTESSGYEGYIRELGDEERLDNLAEFKRIANEFEREFGEKLTLEEFLQQIALQSGEGNDNNQDSVKMMTIHASKGLEFPVVFILGFTEGVFPSSKTIEERKLLGLEEERRLCYVAITRAEKHLYLMDSEGVSPKGIKKLCSRFLDEIGTENYQRIGKIPDDLEQEGKRYIQKQSREMLGANLQPLDKSIGDKVEHHVFGAGTVQGIDEKRGSYLIKFDMLTQPRTISKSYFEKEHIKRSVPVLCAEPEKKESKAIETALIKAPEREIAEVLPKQEANEVIEADIKEPEKIEDTEEIEHIKDAEIVEPEQIEDADIEKIEKMREDEFEVERHHFREISARSQSETQNETESMMVSMPGENPDALDDSIKVAMMEAKEKAKSSPNLWKRDDVPHRGWKCAFVEDLGAPVGICEMCGYQIIRYAHQMEHENYGSLICGCVCAGRMEGNIEEAKRREAELKNSQARRINFFKRKWKQSKKGNDYLKIEDHVIVIYHIQSNGKWKYSIDNEFSKVMYDSRERAMAAAYEQFEKIRKTR